MPESKRFYWIKLKDNFFELETIDWLMSQKNGCEYIVLYQKLCLLTANKNGRLESKVGEMIIPYDANKISRDTKFSIDTVIVAMEIFKKIGLIFEEDDGILKIPYVDELVGSETEFAKKKREYRKKIKEDNEKTLSDKRIEKEIRDKRIDIDIDKEKNVQQNAELYAEIINYLNFKIGTNYRTTSRKTQSLIRARQNEGFTLEDFKKVIDNKVTEWQGTEWEKFLRPETLFGTKFENYLNQKVDKKPEKDEYQKENDRLMEIMFPG